MIDTLRSLLSSAEFITSVLSSLVAALSIWIAARGAASVRSQTRKRFDVAISYAHQDQAKAAELARAMRRRGIKTFIDTDNLAVGADIARAIREVYSSADFIIVLHSSHRSASKWAQLELKSALESSRDRPRILPVSLDDTDFDPSLAGIRHLDGRGMTADEIAEQLSASLRR